MENSTGIIGYNLKRQTTTLELSGLQSQSRKEKETSFSGDLLHQILHYELALSCLKFWQVYKSILDWKIIKTQDSVADKCFSLCKQYLKKIKHQKTPQKVDCKAFSFFFELVFLDKELFITDIGCSSIYLLMFSIVSGKHQANLLIK